MRKTVRYEEIHPLVQSVEIASDMVQCHFLCPVKAKKIVAITRLSKFTQETRPSVEGPLGRVKCAIAYQLKRFLGQYDPEPELVESIEEQRENAIIHAFGKISERFIWSDEHKHFVYRF
jgi:hypothetical protein